MLQMRGRFGKIIASVVGVMTAFGGLNVARANALQNPGADGWQVDVTRYCRLVRQQANGTVLTLHLGGPLGGLAITVRNPAWTPPNRTTAGETYSLLFGSGHLGEGDQDRSWTFNDEGNVQIAWRWSSTPDILRLIEEENFATLRHNGRDIEHLRLEGLNSHLPGLRGCYTDARRRDATPRHNPFATVRQ